MADTPNLYAPKSLLQRLHIVAAISCILIIGLSSSGIYWVYERYIITNAEHDAVIVSSSIVELEKHLLLNPQAEGGSKLIVDSSELSELDQVLKKLLTPHNILKIKIFSIYGEVIYSTDRKIIGQQTINNPSLSRALSGENDSKLQSKEEIQDLSNETRFSVDVVETYVPIRNELNEIVGSFEIYQDITLQREEVFYGVALTVFILTVILILVFLIGFLFLRTAVTQLIITQAQLTKLATTDELTGLLNRRQIVCLGENEFFRYSRKSKKTEHAVFSVIMADLDNFKQINDEYGHLGGDDVLREVSARIHTQMRNYSMLGRYGGEEFLMILPEADEQDVLKVAERIRKAIEATPITCQENEITVTLSLGITTITSKDQSLSEVLMRADKALYSAKNRGRNQVIAGDINTTGSSDP